MTLAGWRSVRLMHGLSESDDGAPLLQVDANDASGHHGAIQVAATLFGLERRAVAGYWRRRKAQGARRKAQGARRKARKAQCQGWPLFHQLPEIEQLFLADAP